MTVRHALERAFVWAGGAIFVGSLGLTAYMYLVRFGGSAPFGDWRVLLINLAALTVFAFHHSFFAREPAKRAVARAVPERLLRSVYVWVASLLLIGLCLAWRKVGGELYDVTGIAMTPFIVAELTGIYTIASAVRAINPLELAGIRESQVREQLQLDGAFGVVRHPLYLGWVLALFATPHMTGDRLAFAVMTTAYLVIAIPWEERSLELSYGDAYRNYMRRVRWRIVPFVY